jgi:uncharacterized protein (TIRG00374 family)
MNAEASSVSNSPSRRQSLRLCLRFGVGLVLIVLLARFAATANLADAYSLLRPTTLLTAIGLTALNSLLGARRWQVLLRSMRIREPLSQLADLYFIGQFCSLFLPTAAGGDAYRMYQLTRRGRPAAAVMLATLQERLLGLASIMLVGLAAALYFHDVLPRQLILPVVCVYALGLTGVATIFAQAWLRKALRHTVYSHLPSAFVGAAKSNALVSRAREFLAPIRHALPFQSWRLTRAACLAMVSCFLTMLTTGVVANALGVAIEPVALCFIVSLVSISRMLPVSPGGIGVGEGAFVYLAGLCGVEPSAAAAVALAVLGAQTSVNLFGGLLLLRRSLIGKREQAIQLAVVPAPLATVEDCLAIEAKRQAA